jgi:hypothetical protein
MGVSASASNAHHAEPPARGYRWIAREIETLKPEADYARIWQLTAMYYTDDTLANLLYTTGMPCFTQSPHGSELLISRTRKAMDRRHERAYDTLSHFWRWFEYGPEHVEAQRSIERVNRIHEALAKGLPEAFSNENFIYTTSWLGTFLHRLRLRLMLGLPGFKAKQKVAAHHFWRSIQARALHEGSGWPRTSCPTPGSMRRNVRAPSTTPASNTASRSWWRQKNARSTPTAGRCRWPAHAPFTIERALES